LRSGVFPFGHKELATRKPSIFLRGAPCPGHLDFRLRLALKGIKR
jgi:hypothetical protein